MKYGCTWGPKSNKVNDENGTASAKDNPVSKEMAKLSSQLIERGLNLFANRLDKEWSLTDCISLVVMEEHGITEAMTTDADFEQAGFVKLLV